MGIGFGIYVDGPDGISVFGLKRYLFSIRKNEIRKQVREGSYSCE